MVSMKTIFIIGGMGSGKSTVGRCFAGFGVPVLDLDKVGHAVLGMPEVKEALVEGFGKAVLDKEGEVDRKALAARAFATPATADTLARITHPAILAELQEWLKAQEEAGNGFAAVEASAFGGGSMAFAFGGGSMAFADIPDYLIAVCAPMETRIKRVLANGFDEKDVERRMALQPTDDQWGAWADFVIESTGSLAHLKAQAKRVWKAITSKREG